VISGVVALILSARPELGYRDVQQVLALSARHADLTDPDLTTNSAGLLVSHNQGFGVPDAGLAVALAKHWTPRSASKRVRVVRNSSLVIPDDSFRLLVFGTGLPSNLRNLRVLPSMGVYPNGGTLAALFDYVGRGQTNLPASVAGHAVLIAGGVNTYADKIARAVALGAKGGFDYTRDGWTGGVAAQVPGGLFDVIVDSAGGVGFEHLIDLAAPGGRIVFFGATRGNPALLPMRKVFWRNMSLLGTTMGSPADWRAMMDFVALHKIVPVVSDLFPLAHAGEAFELMERSGQFGKIVVTM
jgi:hypothetical protein